jgi:hypothetical protein
MEPTPIRMLNSASPDRPQYESSTIMVPVKNAPTTAPKIVIYAEFAQSYIAHPKMVRLSFLTVSLPSPC